jgi:hypothetical protein
MKDNKKKTRINAIECKLGLEEGIDMAELEIICTLKGGGQRT